MNAADDAAVLFLAANGWGPKLTCRHIPGEDDVMNDPVCGKPMVGVSADDGSPLCEEHVDHPEEEGHRLAPEVLEAIKRLRIAHFRDAGEEPT